MLGVAIVDMTRRLTQMSEKVGGFGLGLNGFGS